ncbi:hypothetical protein [Alteromonas sp. BMJM2]|uniref:hypothetical protein n=1 Tax=Alteromonas sp. BMJM2 TaxID=2954241 RepID=UPI0022B4DD4E|nr:hypothetical protein [Alteromonas sp. BMJM2]
MKLSEFFDHLSFGELAQYSIGTDDSGKIAVKDYPRMVSIINLGLTRLHVRLPLVVKRLNLEVTSDRKEYLLSSSVARTSMLPTDDVKDFYLLDEGVVFEDNVLAVIGINDEDGTPIVFNNEFAEDTVLVDASRIKFDDPVPGIYSITYQANHPRIPMSKRIDPETIDLDIPEYLVEILLQFCAGKVLGSGGNIESIQEGQVKMQIFEKLVAQIEESGMVPEPTPTAQRHRDSGWV